MALEDLPGGIPRAARAGTTAVVLLRIDDRVYATEALCPHKFGPLSDGRVENGRLVCPIHDAHFDPATGRPRSGDAWAGELATFPVRVRDGTVEVRIEQVDL